MVFWLWMARGVKGQMSQPYCGPNLSCESFLNRNLSNPLFHLELDRNLAYIGQPLERICSLYEQFRRLINTAYIVSSHLLFQLSNSEEELKAGVSPCLPTLLLKSKAWTGAFWVYLHILAPFDLSKETRSYLIVYKAIQEKISENNPFVVHLLGGNVFLFPA